MIENQHISDDIFLAFQQEQQNREEKIKFLMHVSECDYCSEKLASIMESVKIPVPPDMKQNIIMASKRVDVQIVKNAREMTNKMQLFIYSIKVGAATVGAFVILLLFMNSYGFSGSQSQIETDSKNQSKSNTYSLTNLIREGTESLNDNLFNFSNDIIKMEESNHDK